MKPEEWKPIVGYEGLYEVSNRGRVKRIKSGRGARAGYVLKPYPNGMPGYLCVSLYRDSVLGKPLVSRLVAEAFLVEPILGMAVHHIDENPANNFASNLQVIPQPEHARSHNRGTGAPMAKLNDDAVREIRALLASGQLQRKIAKVYGVDKQTISCIKTGRTWAHVV